MCDESDQFSLRWNNFHSNLATGFHALLQGEDLVDVTLAAGGKFIQAHKIVLSVCSPYFKELFKVNPCKHPIVILKDVYYKELVAILQFMYKGEVNVRQEELATFLKTAEMLQVKGLTGDETPTSESPPPPPLGQIQPQSETKLKTKVQPSHTPTHSKTPPHTSDTKSLNPSTSSEELQSVKSLKRRRSISPKPSPSATSIIHSEDSSPVTVEHIEITRPPKTEPPDYDSDLDSGDLSVGNSSHHHTSDNLSHLLASESSQQKLELGKSGSHLFAAIPGLSHENLSSHESGVQDAATEFHNPWYCWVCSKVFSNKSHLQRHNKNTHGPLARPHNCTTCHKVYKNALQFHEHNRIYHGLPAKKKEEN